MLMMSNFLGNGVASIIKSSQVDSTRIIAISGICGLLIVYIFLTIFNYKSELNIFEKVNSLFIKPFNYFINFILILLAFIFLSISIYNIMAFITSQFLANTPKIIIGISFTLLVIYICIIFYQNLIISTGQNVFFGLYYNYYQRDKLLCLFASILSSYYHMMNIIFLINLL